MRGVMPWRPGDLPARVRARAAQIEPGHRRPVLRPAGKRPAGKHLPGHHIQVANVPIRQPNPLFEVRGRQQLPVQEGAAKVGCIAGEGVDELLTDGVSLLLPGPRTQTWRRIEHPDRHHMLAGTAQGGVVDRGNLEGVAKVLMCYPLGVSLLLSASTVVLGYQLLTNAGVPTLLGYAWIPTLLAGVIMVVGGRLARKRLVSTWYWENPEIVQP